MDLQTFGGKTVKKLAFDHVIHSIKRMNKSHRNEAKNRALQAVLFKMLEVSRRYHLVSRMIGLL